MHSSVTEQNLPLLLQVQVLPTCFLEETRFQGLDYQAAYNAKTETEKFVHPLYFQLLRQYF